MMTTHPVIFAGGDIVDYDHTVTSSIGHGKKAAEHIDAWLRQTNVESKEKKAPESFQELNTWNYIHASHPMRERSDTTRRIKDFSEVVLGLDKSTALYKAPCFIFCGNCFECDNFFGVCPDHAVKKIGPGFGFAIDLDCCKGLRHLREKIPVECDQDVE